MRTVLIAGFLILSTIATIVAIVKIWRYRNRDFRAAVVIENLRLWRELIQGYRNEHPLETYSVDVATEATYNAMQSGTAQKIMLTRAWDNVKKMTKFIVQECREGKNAGPVEVVYANSDFEAFKAVAYRDDLRRVGKLGELRVRVKPASNPAAEVCFYASLPHLD